MLTREQTEIILDQLNVLGIKQVTFETGTSAYECVLCPDDRDYVTFHKYSTSPYICDKLEVCVYETTKEPIYKDWYMTINYHS